MLGVLLSMSVVLAEAREVTGSVKCGKEKIEGAVVSDGKNFSVTAKNGKFRMDISDDADFVFVITPGGYTVPFESGAPVFYLDAGGRDRFDFQLVKAKTDKDYAIFAIADPQSKTEEHFRQFLESGYPDLCKTVKDYSEKTTVVGLALGDICWDSMNILPMYKEAIAKTEVPFYAVIGNHDHVKEMKGDHNASSEFRNLFGPENYAFGIGDDYVVVLDNIVYDTQKKYEEEYSEDLLDWVEGLLEYIPSESHIYIAQHGPVFYWFKDNSYACRGEKLLELLKGRSVTFLSGHTHINNNIVIAPGIVEMNVASICGAWLDTYHCIDGTPSGYKIIEKKDGKIKSLYKSVGRGKDFQVEVFKPGESRLHPNGVVANVWDCDPSWIVEWFQDGRPMGAMKQVLEYSPYYCREIKACFIDNGKKVPGYKRPKANFHYFLAEPDQYTKTVTVSVKAPDGRSWKYDADMGSYIDLQAHRGGAGLMPENTVSAMKTALDLGVNTLELDLQVSGDGKVVVSHDAYFHSRYATRPDGTEVRKSDPKEYIYTMPYDSVARYDTGLRDSTVWPGKACIAEHKPLADELLDFTENYARDNGLTMPRYNVEIKSRAGKGEGVDWPEYHEFVDKCMELLLSKDLGDRLVVQSFDVRALNYMHEKYPHVKLSYLVDEDDVDFDAYMSLLDFIPAWLSPHYSTVDENLCHKVREKGMKIVPWTVDEPSDIERMAELKVDAIISNYPDRLLNIVRGY